MRRCDRRAAVNEQAFFGKTYCNPIRPTYGCTSECMRISRSEQYLFLGHLLCQEESLAKLAREGKGPGRAGRADFRGGQHTLGVCRNWIRFCRVFDGRQRAVAAPSCNDRRVSDVLAVRGRACDSWREQASQIRVDPISQPSPTSMQSPHSGPVVSS